MRDADLHFAAGLRDAPHLLQRLDRIRQVLEHVIEMDFVRAARRKWVRSAGEIVDHVDPR